MKQVTIRNTTSRMVVVPLNSGRNLFLPPGGSSPGVPETEIQPNARVEKLLGRKAILLKSPTPAVKSSKPRAKRPAPQRKKAS